MNSSPKIGDVVVCAETGKPFVVESNGFTFNYATDKHGNVYSDEGVRIREARELLDRTRPFYAYLSSDGRHVTGWKGNVLGEVSNLGVSRTGWNGAEIARFRVKDIHGNWWQARGTEKGMCCLRPMRAPK